MTATAQDREDRINDVSESSIIFQGAKRGLTTQVAENVADAKLEETMQGASDLSVELRDHGYEALNSGLFGTRFFCSIDSTRFRYVELSLVSQYLLRVSFEHELIAEMREHTGNVKAIRGKVTRAEFILHMLKELKRPYRFICPELHRTQPTPAPEQIKETHDEKPAAEQVTVPNLEAAGRGAGIDKSGLTVKKAAMTDAQARILTIALQAAEATGANELSMQALVVALIQENTVSNPDPGEPGDRGALSLIDSTIHGIQKKNGSGTINPYDIAEVCEHFCAAGYAGSGGSNALARAHPDYTATKIGTLVQGPAVEYPHTWEGEAAAIVKAFMGGGAGTHTVTVQGASSTVATVRTATYEFSRGKPGEPEDTYTCALRLAEEVGWRFFVVGKRDIYFVNDNDLLRAAARYIIEPDTEGLVEDPTFDLEVGNRTVIERGKRVPKPSECELHVRADRYAAPPGTVVELKGWGPADGKWLVDTVERSLYDAGMTIHLRAPQKPLEEPKATESTSEPTSSQQATQELGQSGTANRSVEAKLAKEHPELQPGVRKVVAIILTQFPEMTITSTTNHSYLTTNGNKSLHVEGRAADLVGGNMDAIGTWIAKNLGSLLTEGIHNPTLSVKDGKVVPASFWGAATWEQHLTHIHVGV
jgi:hypothetical protein